LFLPIADNDECKLHPDSNCTHPTCENSEGSYTCGCDIGYEHNTKDPDGAFYCFGES